MSTTIKTALLALATYAALGAVGYAYRDHSTVQRHLRQFDSSYQQPAPSQPVRFGPGY